MSAGHESHGSHGAHGSHEEHVGHHHHVDEKSFLESWWPAFVIGWGLVLVISIDLFNRT